MGHQTSGDIAQSVRAPNSNRVSLEKTLNANISTSGGEVTWIKAQACNH